MRHGKKFNHLGRTASHRSALLSNMACSLIEHKRINTTVAKAKALRVYVEPILTKAKEDTTHNRRIAFSYLQSKEAVAELFRTEDQVSANVAYSILDNVGGIIAVLSIGFLMSSGISDGIVYVIVATALSYFIYCLAQLVDTEHMAWYSFLIIAPLLFHSIFYNLSSKLWIIANPNQNSVSPPPLGRHGIFQLF